MQLWRSYDCLKALEEEVFSRFDLSAQQYNVLRLLDAAYPDGVPTMKLGKRLISRAPDTTRMIDRLVKRDLVTRVRPTENRRVVEAVITAQGRQLLKDMSTEVVDMHSRQLGHLSSNQLTTLVKLLRTARRPHEDQSCDWID